MGCEMALDMPEMDVYGHEISIGSIQIPEMALNMPELDVY